MVENPCGRSVGAKGGNQAVRTRGGNNRREQEAGRSLRNAAFRAEPKKLCINTTLSINDKTVYKHVFPVLRTIDPKQNILKQIILVNVVCQKNKVGIVFWGFGLVGFVLSKYGRKSMRKVGGGKRWEPSGPNKRREQ